jgi:hypothetical protein
LVAARDYRGASELIGAILREHRDWPARYGPVLDGLQIVISLGLGDDLSARMFLARVLMRPVPRTEHLLALAIRLLDFGAAGQARDILVQAFAAEPSNQAVLTRLVELDLNLNRIDELPGHLGRLVSMRQPSPDILRVAQHKLGSDLFLFSPDRAPALDGVQLALEKYRSATPRF